MRALVRVLDDGMSTRLHYQICDQKGLAYSIAGSLHSYHDAALLEIDAACAHAKLPALVGEVAGACWADFREELVTEDELDKTKRRFVGDVEASLRRSSTAWPAGSAAPSCSCAPSRRRSGPQALSRVRPEDIREVARRVIRPERLSVTSVGALSPKLAQRVEQIVRDFR